MQPNLIPETNKIAVEKHPQVSRFPLNSCLFAREFFDLAVSFWNPLWITKKSGEPAAVQTRRFCSPLLVCRFGIHFGLPIFHLGLPRKTDPTKCQISLQKLRKKLFFGGLGGVHFIHFEGTKQSGKLPLWMTTLGQTKEKASS